MTDRGPGGGDAGTGDRSDGIEPPDPGEIPDFVAARDHVVDELVRFARALRRAGVAVPANAATVGARALVEVGFERDRVRPALRATFVTRKEDLETFEGLFPEFWRRLSAGLGPTGPADRPGSDAPDGGFAPLDGSGAPGETAEDANADADDPEESVEVAVREAYDERGGDGDDEIEEADDEDADVVTTAAYSSTGTPTPVSVDSLAPAADEEVSAALADLARALATLRGRRFVGGGDDRPDVRRSLRESFATGGTVLSVPRRERTDTAVRAVLLVDVSQSVVDVVDGRFLVSFLRAATGWRQTRVFFFDDRVREVTDQLDAATTDEALAALDRAQTEWGGGTRIGHAVETVRRTHPSAVDRDTVVFVVSDGLEVGEIDRLEDGMAWLSRRAASVLWLNPLAASPEYEPVCRGMAAALPYVDGLFAFSGPGDLRELARQVRLQGTGGTIGYEQDPRRYGRDG